MKVKSESDVAQSCPTLSDPMDCSPPGSSVHGIFQARVLEWGAIAFSACWYRIPRYGNLKALSVNVMSPTNNCILKAKVMTYTLLKDIQYRDSLLIVALSGMQFSFFVVDKIAENN